MSDAIHPHIDLHTHTTASDGQDTPAELVNFAVQQGVSVLGVTDHDTVDALAEVQRHADNAGITLVPGVELSTTVDRAEVHVLGYFVDSNDQRLIDALAEQARKRFSRIERIIEKVQSLGYDIDGDAILAHAAFGTIGRPHVARALMAIGAATDISDAFERFLKAGRPGYVPRDPFSPEEAVRLLVKHNAIPVLAHPYSTKDIEGTLKRLVPEGLRGFETYYAEYTPEQHSELRSIADAWQLIPTGGSDYHGVRFREGRVLGSAPVPQEVAERLFAAHETTR
jgi:predicted metal-dependent phosphoesterase TrpH